MKTDPRVRLLIILLLTTLAVLAKDIFWLAIITVIALIATLCFKTNILNAVKRLKHFIWLLVFIAIVQSLTIKGGKPLIVIGKVKLLSTSGLIFAGEFILRMSVIVFAGLIAASADGREMTDGLLKLGLPYEFAFMSGIAIRYLPVFRDEFNARINAIALRGINIKKLSFVKKLKVYAYLISPTITGCVLRSEELARSMESRGFRAERKRTMYRDLKMTSFDWLLTVISLIMAVAYLVCMYYFKKFNLF